MKFARHTDKMIQLHSDTYTNIPHWRVLASNNQLQCPLCEDALRLVAGVSFEPFFTHTTNTMCPYEEMDELPAEYVLKHESSHLSSQEVAVASDSTVNEPEDESTWQGGFRLPRGRSIQSDSTPPPVAKPKSYRIRLAPKQAIQAIQGERDNSLHPFQRQAVQHTEGPLLILAGAGSGKTKVMTARAAHLIHDKQVDPRSIMVVTFTTKAAEEMKQRLAATLTRTQASQLITGTFHSLFYRMITHHDPKRWDNSRLLKQEWQKCRMIRETGILHPTEIAHLSESDLQAALGYISRWKNENLSPQAITLTHASTDEERNAQILYPLYEEAKQKAHWFDFDDMLMGCYELLRDNEKVRTLYQERIQYLMIDEFQDINQIQYETVKLLAAPQNNLCVIGDDDQSIYGFRGSNPSYILNFTKDYPNAHSITLEVNYRSRSAIVGLGYSLINNNRARWKKELKSFHPEEGESILFHPEDEEEQASRIVDEILYQMELGASVDQFAILFRTYESTRPIWERLSEAKIPVAFTLEDEPFYQKQVVRFALGYLRTSVDWDDALAIKEILPTLYVSASLFNEIRSQAILEDVSLLEILPQLTSLKPYQRKHLQKVKEVLSQLGSCTPAQALEAIYEELKLRDYVKKRAKERAGQEDEHATDDLRQLLIAARRHVTIKDFLTYVQTMLTQEQEWRKQQRNQRTNSGSVQMMSIHRAKGLEFDTVFVVDTVEGVLPHEYALDQLRQSNNTLLEEERRLMYVAITRARHNLYIGVPIERFGRKTRASRFIQEMGQYSSVPSLS
ncbi:ATP-dependent helicase [Brevibacillus ginsengisoli]|uniref:ATP-dependent helicase n=1 Tax=Brevibacillus ginsengisoli TaxID=363854 RepID=UPI003CFB18D3